MKGNNESFLNAVSPGSTKSGKKKKGGSASSITSASAMSSKTDRTTSLYKKSADAYKSLHEPNKRLTTIESSFGLPNSEISDKIQEIASRDLLQISVIDNQIKNNVTDKAFNINNVKVSLVCYQKGNVEQTFREIRVRPISLEDEKFRREIKEQILQREREHAQRFIGDKIVERQREEELIDESPWKKSYITMQKLLEKEFKDVSKIAKSVFNPKAKFDWEGYKERLSLGEITEFTQQSIELIDHYLSLKTTGSDNGAGARDELLRDLNLNFEEYSARILSSLDITDENYPTLESYENAKTDLTKLTKELDYLAPSNIYDKELVDDIVGLLRGHSEDYLMHYLDTTQEFDQEIETLLMDPQNRGINFNRFYLIVTSTRESCNRCTHLVENIAESVRNKLSVAMENPKKFKLFYISKEDLTKKRIQQEQDPINISDDEHDDRLSVHIERPLLSGHCDTSKASNDVSGITDNESLLLSPMAETATVNTSYSNIHSSPQAGPRQDQDITPGWSNGTIEETPEGKESIHKEIADSYKKKRDISDVSTSLGFIDEQEDRSITDSSTTSSAKYPRLHEQLSKLSIDGKNGNYK